MRQPVDVVRITSGFGMRTRNGKPDQHYGIDYGAKVAGVAGDPVYDVADGVVKVAKNDPEGYGNYIMIEHKALGITTLYAHLQTMCVKPGDVVTAGTVIGTMGSTGRSSGAHLHLEIRLVLYSSGRVFDKYTNKEGKSVPMHCTDPWSYLVSRIAGLIK